MKKNTFYLLAGIVVIFEVAAFWWSLSTSNALVIEVAFVLGIGLIYLAKRRITEVIEDERTAMITQKAALRTLEVFWVIFFALGLGQVVIGFGNIPGFSPSQIPSPFSSPPSLDQVGMLQLAFLCLLIFLYVGFRMYYAQKYGELDEEQD
jgi:uncharacterized membrane protein